AWTAPRWSLATASRSASTSGITGFALSAALVASCSARRVALAPSLVSVAAAASTASVAPVRTPLTCSLARTHATSARNIARITTTSSGSCAPAPGTSRPTSGIGMLLWLCAVEVEEHGLAVALQHDVEAQAVVGLGGRHHRRATIRIEPLHKGVRR